MDTKVVHENYHSKVKLQRKIISNKNFTYRNSLEYIETIFDGAYPKILDVGSGVGTLDFYLSRKAESVIGIDISSKAILVARRNAKLFKLKNIKFYIGNVNKFKFSSKFDLIICSEIIEHVQDDNKLLKDLSKHLSKDGVIFLTTPLETAPLHKVGLDKSFDKRVGHLRRYTLNKLRKIIKSQDLKIVKVEYGEGVIRNSIFIFPIFDQLGRVANKFSIASDFITFIDNISLKLFGPSNIYLVIKKK